MKLIYAAFVLLSVFLTSAQCQQTAEDWVKKGNAFQSQGKYDEAIKAYDEAIRLDPNLAYAWSNKGGGLSPIKANTMNLSRLMMKP